MKTNEWFRVSHRNPCPICKKPDWCGYTENGIVRCMRTQAGQQPKHWQVLKVNQDDGVIFRRKV